MDDLEVCDLRVLTFGYKVPAEGNVFRALSEACLFRESDGCFAVLMMMSVICSCRNKK